MGDDFDRIVGAHRADVGDQPGRADDHLDLAADLAGHGDRRVGMVGEAEQHRRVEARLRSRAGDFDDMADRRQRRGGRRLRRGGAGLVAEAAHFIEELPKIRLIGHACTRLTH